MIEMLGAIVGTLVPFFLWTLFFFSIFCAVFALFVMYGIYLLNKMLIELPRFTWLTFEEVVERGFSPFWSKVMLPTLYTDGYTEVTPKEERPYYNYYIARHKRLGVYDYRPATVHDFYFRIIHRGGTRKRKKRFIFIPLPTPHHAI